MRQKDAAARRQDRPAPAPPEPSLAHSACECDLPRALRRRNDNQERDYALSFEHASIGIAHLDLNGQWLEVNQALCDIVGYRREELMALRFQDMTCPEDLATDLAMATQLLSGDIPNYRLEKRYIRKDGSLVWIRLNATVVHDQHGRPTHFVSVVEDIHDRRVAEDALLQSQRRLQTAMDATQIGLFDYFGPIDPRNYWSTGVHRHFGIPNDATLTIDRLLRLIHPDDAPRVTSAIAASMAQPGMPYHEEYRTLGEADGVLRWIEATGKTFLDKEIGAVRMVGTTLDVTPRKTLEAELRSSAMRFRTAFDNIPDVVVIYDRDLRIQYINPATTSTTGLPVEAFLGKREDEIFPPAVIRPWQPLLQDALNQGRIGSMELEAMLPPGPRSLQITCVPLRRPDGEVAEVMGITHDFTDRKQAEEQAVRAALHDKLTGLPNRALLFEYSSHVFDRARRGHHEGAVLFIDLDRFKPINDLHGHQAGDSLLIEVAQRIEQCVRKSDMAFRIGGDEFLVLLPHLEDRAEAARIAQRLNGALARPFTLGHTEVGISASIGISLFPHDGEDMQTLVNAADNAMYLAKEVGKNQWQFFSSELSGRVHSQLVLQQRLRGALSRGEFELVFQPLVDAQSGHLKSVEALLRWPEGGVGPDQFIPAAEAIGQIIAMGDWVIDEACRTHRQWLADGLPAVPIAVNVSTRQLRQQDFRTKLLGSLRAHGLPPAALQIEITESAMIEELDKLIVLLTELRRDGIRISLDDFGTGYSSLSYLSRLPIDKIKIDKSFVWQLSDRPESRAITEAIVMLGQRLSLEVVAEGIETDEMRASVITLGCTQLQGYLFSRPLKASQLPAWMNAWRPANVPDAT